MKKILIALDYDPSAQNVAESGYALANSMQANVTLLHVMADYAYYSSVNYSPIMGFNSFINSDFSQVAESEALTKAAEDFLIKTRTFLGDESIQVLIKDGNAGDQILETAKEMNADFIVLGKHSRSVIEKIIMGSVTQKVLQQSKIPLLIIPTETESE